MKLISQFFGWFFIIFLISCNGGYTNGAVGRTYNFICNDLNNSCQECDSNWFIYIYDENYATLYSSPSKNSSIMSCMTSVRYEFDSITGSIIINEMTNPNINYNCSNSFLGTWTFNENGSRGRGFYESSNCGFVR